MHATALIPAAMALLVVVGIPQHVGRCSRLARVCRCARSQVYGRNWSERDGAGVSSGMLSSIRPWRLESTCTQSCCLLCCLPFLARCDHVSIGRGRLLRWLGPSCALVVLLLECSFVLLLKSKNVFMPIIDKLFGR